ncbi:unnamed protein product [marine sediment metagenome]|uniref:Uncharacterized protein n=1 Tax=marine sediment metagenome TaxID=412755 RepID=X0X2L7_9ZZZZ
MSEPIHIGVIVNQIMHLLNKKRVIGKKSKPVELKVVCLKDLSVRPQGKAMEVGKK